MSAVAAPCAGDLLPPLRHRRALDELMPTLCGYTHHLAYGYLLRLPASNAFFVQLCTTLARQPIEVATATTSDVCLFPSNLRLHQLTATRSDCIECQERGDDLSGSGAAPSDAYRGLQCEALSGEVGRSSITEVMKLTIGLLRRGMPLR